MKNKKKVKKRKKKRVLRRMFFYNSDEGSEERVPKWEDSAVARGYCYNLDKTITFVDVVYLRYLVELDRIHEYNWGEIFWCTCTPS